jgi:hypothetical protein
MEIPRPTPNTKLSVTWIGVASMISRGTQVDISYLHRQGISRREIGKKTGHDPRTVKR